MIFGPRHENIGVRPVVFRMDERTRFSEAEVAASAIAEYWVYQALASGNKHVDARKEMAAGGSVVLYASINIAAKDASAENEDTEPIKLNDEELSFLKIALNAYSKRERGGDMTTRGQFVRMVENNMAEDMCRQITQELQVFVEESPDNLYPRVGFVR